MKKLKRIDWIKIGSAILCIIIVITVIAGVVASIENEKNKITEGIIIDKSYTEGYITYTNTRIGKIIILQPHHHPEKYSFQLRGEKDGKTVTYWLTVSKEDYNEYKIGDYYNQ